MTLLLLHNVISSPTYIYIYKYKYIYIYICHLNLILPGMVPKLLEMLQPPETAEPSAVAAPGDLPVEPVSPTSPVSPVSRAVPGLEASSTELTLVGRADGWVYTDYTVYIYICRQFCAGDASGRMLQN